MLPLLLSVSSFDSSGFLTELVAAFVMFFDVAFGDVFSAELRDAFCVVAVVTVEGFCVTVVFCVCDAFSFCSASSLASMPFLLVSPFQLTKKTREKFFFLV